MTNFNQDTKHVNPGTSSGTEGVGRAVLSHETLHGDQGALEALPAAYRDKVFDRYQRMGQTANRLTNEGRLNKLYQLLPSIGAFAERIVRLGPSYEKMEEKRWQPEVVFVPKGMTAGQWNDVLKQPNLGGEYKCAGLDGWPAGLYPSDITPSDLWDVAVVSATPEAALARAHPDSEWGRKAAAPLLEMPGDHAGDDASTIRKFCTPHDVYLSLQLARLERRADMVDIVGPFGSIARETPNEETLFMGSEDHSGVPRYVLFAPLDLEEAIYLGSGGIRPCVTGRDVL